MAWTERLETKVVGITGLNTYANIGAPSLGLRIPAATSKLTPSRSPSTALWYHKAQSTFVDCLALVCRHLWRIRDQVFTTHNTGALKELGYRCGHPCDDRG